MTNGEEFLRHLEEMSRRFPGRTAEDVAVRFTALCYAAAYVIAAKRVHGEFFLDDADRHLVSDWLLRRFRMLTVLMSTPDGEALSYEAFQLASSIHEQARWTLKPDKPDEPEWIERYPEFQRTLARTARALEIRTGSDAIEALHRETAALAEATSHAGG